MRASARTRAVPSVLAVVALAAAAGACADTDHPPAELVLRGGTVVTVDSTLPRAEAVAVSGDTIVAVGTDAEIAGYVGTETEVVELDGRLAVPGFIEGHGHYMSLGRAKLNLDLTGARSWDEIVEHVAAAAGDAEPGEWIVGRGWHQEKWEETPSPSVEGLPVHTSLSRATPENPVVLGHASGHASFVDARAMELAGIDAGTEDPPGGEIVRDAAGNPTGVLRETAQGLVSEARAEARQGMTEEERERERRRIARLAAEEALSKGVTSFHDAGADFGTIDFYRTLADEGNLPVRLYVMVRRESNEVMAEKLPEYRLTGYADHHLVVRSIKRQVDGALGSHGAWLLDPYADLPRSTGLVLEPLDEIARTAEIAVEHGFQVNTHAIGDRANREILDLYEAAFVGAGADGDTLRWRIEHAQHIHPDDVPRFGELGVIAAMQGIHMCSDAPWVFKRLGEERAESGAYVWRDLMETGAVVTNGTDVPVEDIDPLASFHCSVTRRAANGELFFPAQAMSRAEALRSYTLSNAYAAFQEDVLGSITPGKLADITVLDRDIMTIPAAEIPEARVDLTVVGGEIRYRRPSPTPPGG